jgi:hypothetical protein
MKTRFVIKRDRPLIFLMLSLMIAFCFGSCKDDGPNNEDNTPPYDSSKPVVVTDFYPTSGGGGQRLLIHGSNLGNSASAVRVFIGGKEAKVVGVGGGTLYCIVPRKAFMGDIELRFGQDPDVNVVRLADSFKYQRSTIVSTLCGYKNDRDDQGWRDGPFTGENDIRTVGFREPSFMKFDPRNRKHLYISYDNTTRIQLINLEDSTVVSFDRPHGNWSRIRSVDFTLDKDHMIVATDRDNAGDNSVSTSILARSSDQFNRFGFDNPQILTTFRQCNGASIHPVNGELYFNSYGNGELRRYDILNSEYFGGTLRVSDHTYLYNVQDTGWEFNIQIHPTGNYAYIVVVNQHYILRTDYDWANSTFLVPSVICGQSRTSGYEDGVGTMARLRNPYQGVFVKNPDYVAAGKSDEYDFYFTEQHNHDIRILTPEGKVTTFAGRGSSSLNPDPWGYIDGEARMEARFDRPTGLAYDEEENIFYVGDQINRRIRKIEIE